MKFLRLPDAWAATSSGTYARLFRFKADMPLKLDAAALSVFHSVFDQVKLGDYQIGHSTPET